MYKYYIPGDKARDLYEIFCRVEEMKAIIGDDFRFTAVIEKESVFLSHFLLDEWIERRRVFDADPKMKI